MIQPRHATSLARLTQLESLARSIWPLVYSRMISRAQMDYMLHWMYAPEVLLQKAEAGHQFHLWFIQEEAVGYTHWWADGVKARLEKIYLHPDAQGGGHGKQMLAFVAAQAEAAGCSVLELNVNRSNSAVAFYEALGFVVADSIDADIGGGFFMNDFIMQRSLKSG